MATLWNHVRGAGRLAAMLAVIVSAALAYVVRSSLRRDARSKARWLQQTCRRVLRVLAVKVESHGESAWGAVIVSNHLSYLDILVLASATPVVFVSKKEVRAWPVFGWFAEKAGTRFIDRGRRSDVARIGDELVSGMAQELSVALFLEGTTTDGRTVLPFKSSLLEPALSHGWKVAPVGLNYTVTEGRSVENEVCWWGEMTLAPHLWNLATLPQIIARVAWGETLVAAGDRKLLAEELRQKVIALRMPPAAA